MNISQSINKEALNPSVNRLLLPVVFFVVCIKVVSDPLNKIRAPT